MARHTKRHKTKTAHFNGIAVREVRPGYYLADTMRAGVRIRKAFQTIEAARLWCGVKAIEAINHGTDALRFTDRERIEYRDAVKILAGRATLAEAVRFWMDKHPCTGADSWDIVSNRYLVSMREANRRELSIQEKQLKFDILGEALTDAPPILLDVADIEAAVDALGKGRKWGHVTREAYRGAGLTLVRFAKGQSKRLGTRDETPPETWDADTVAVLMHAAEAVAPGAVAALAVMAFAGVRPNEALRLRWEHIDFNNRLIVMGGDVTKTRTTRHVEIRDNLLAWLVNYRCADGLLARSSIAMRAQREKAMHAADIATWPKDVLRHTAATMIYAETGDVNHVCKQLGHNGGSDVFLRHYRGLAPAPDIVARFWSIVPAHKEVSK